MKRNIALIGMAGVGKSHIGKRLSEKIGCVYIEADRLITLEADKIGVKKDRLSDDDFIRLEEKTILRLSNKENAVVDTGGSVVYSKKAMKSLKSNAVIVYLKDDVENVKKRFKKRGEPHLIGSKGKSFKELFRERNRLYEKYADIAIVVSDNKNLQNILDEIILKIKL